MKYRFYIFLIVLGYVDTTTAGSANTKSESYLGLSLLDMTYKEFDDSGVLLDREDGVIPGFVLRHKSKKNNIFTDLSYSYHSSDVEYDGQTQSGIPAKTRSDAHIYEFQFKIGKELDNKNQNTFDIYAGLGYRFWQRNIRSTFIASGIYEEYDWSYYILGTRIPLFGTYRNNLTMDIQYTAMIDADIFVELSDFGADDLSLALGKEDGYRLSLPWRIQNSNRSIWIIEPYYESWDIGKSEIKPITINGIPTNFIIWEPRSETRNVGINIQLAIPF